MLSTDPVRCGNLITLFCSMLSLRLRGQRSPPIKHNVKKK
jgi:hypothetical protein